MLNPQDDIEIRNLVATYADAVGARDLDAWRATWSATGVWQIGDKEVEGIDSIVEFMTGALERFPMLVQTAFAGRVQEDSAGKITGLWPVMEIQHSGESEEGMVIGRYEDEYVQESGRWVFARRRFQALYRGPIAAGMQPR